MADETDDSLLRAVAAAPPCDPPERIAAAAQAPVRRRRWLAAVVTTGAIAVAIVLLVGLGRVAFAPSGLAVAQWTLDVNGGAHGVAVELPSNLWDEMHLDDAGYTLRTELALDPQLRRHTLTLVEPCFHAPLALAVDGIEIVDRGDVAVGDHRFVIDAERTDRDHIELVLTAHHDTQSSAGYGIAPHVVVDAGEASTTALVNRYSALVALVLAALFAFLYGVLAVLDRKRTEYRAIIIGMVATIVICLYLLGALTFARDTPLGRVAPAISGLCTVTMFLSILTFMHRAFELGPLPRIFRWAFGVIALAAIVGTFVRGALVPYSILLALFAPSAVIYNLVRCARIARTGAHRYEARILLVWAIPQLGATLTENVWRWRGVNLVSGLHSIGLMMSLLVLAQTTVLVVQFIARQHTIERTTDELRHQVAARSRELADVLGELANRPRARLRRGETIDERYRIIAPLGAGGMGSVYEVERVTDGQHFALKTLRDRVDVALTARLAREAQLAAELRHRNLVPVLDVGIADGSLYLVMELVSGGTLERQRERFGERDWALPILRDVARGLAAIHARGIVHRDLKPANILVDNGVPRIADFGLAAFHVAAAGALDDTVAYSPQLTRHGDVFGTPAYMAPELARGTAAAPASSDVFSLGVIAHELLCGRAPFIEPPVVARVAGRDVAIAIAELDPAARSIVERCLSLDPAQRPTAAEVVIALGG